MANDWRWRFVAALQIFAERLERVYSFHFLADKQASEEKDCGGEVHAEESPAEIDENESKEPACDFDRNRRGGEPEPGLPIAPYLNCTGRARCSHRAANNE